jgi:cation transport protein ChaC
MAGMGRRRELWVFGFGSLSGGPTSIPAAPARVAWLAPRAQDVEPHQPRHAGAPGLVFGLLTGGCCRGVVFRIDKEQAPAVLAQLWSAR